MTKLQELEILAKIEKLIQSAGADSYIGMTFSGIVEVCLDNIKNDFGACPVEDLKLAREGRDAAQKELKEKNAELERIGGALHALEEKLAAVLKSLHKLAQDSYAENRAKLEAMPIDADESEVAKVFRNMKLAEAAFKLSEE
ncbi:MAG: hypothetical protein J6Q14_08030 [Oscillospiraceae bacterium]|nr:hypothetical protein [Oscillospiraceae bacterium]